MKAIDRHLDLFIVFVPPEDAGEHFGFLGNLLAVDSPPSSTLTRQLLGWEPTHLELIADLDQGHYCRYPSA